jgi:hypothetical protein
LSGQEDKAGLRFRSHPSEDVWEEYALGRLPKAQLADVEEHLLGCDACQLILERADTLVQTVRSAGYPVVVPPSAPPPGVPSRAGWIPFAPRSTFVALSLGLLIAVGIGLFRFGSPSNLPVASVSLSSFRGDSMAVAPAGRPLTIEIPRSDLAPIAGYTLEVVTLSGRAEWKGTPETASGKLVCHLPKGLVKGRYWVRVYDPQVELIREFGLSVEQR